VERPVKERGLNMGEGINSDVPSLPSTFDSSLVANLDGTNANFT